MSSSKNDLYYLGNGWGWFVSIDYIDTSRFNHYTPDNAVNLTRIDEVDEGAENDEDTDGKIKVTYL